MAAKWLVFVFLLLILGLHNIQADNTDGNFFAARVEVSLELLWIQQHFNINVCTIVIYLEMCRS
jgi:hypothetical protein